MSSASTYIPESETTFYYPASKRKKIVNDKGEVIYDSAKASALDEIKRYQYRYKSSDGQYYILVYYEIGLDGISRAKWSKYCYLDDDSNNYEEEDVPEQINLSKDFDDMIESEGWEKESESPTIILIR
jgi:hypothetical protein